MRRQADEVAQRSLRQGKLGMEGVTVKLIDAYFGWCLKEMMADMQTHYAGLDRPARRMLARVTIYL